eukprot:1023191-Lingulodinium_polyedra.AAC.1
MPDLPHHAHVAGGHRARVLVLAHNLDALGPSVGLANEENVDQLVDQRRLAMVALEPEDDLGLAGLE